MSAETCTIALLGQPNSGKSTLFNALTGSHQRVGNWPGKTVEKKEGNFRHGGKTWRVIDLPGSYSLTALSGEEKITRDCIAAGDADLVCILADASQLERSLFMLADFALLGAPAILLLNMMDVAKVKGRTIDAALLEERLGIPVLPFVAANRKEYAAFYRALEKPPRVIKSVPEIDAEEGDVLASADIKFKWIEKLLEGAVRDDKQSGAMMSRFDRLATSKRWGKAIAIGLVLAGLIAAMIPFIPVSILAGFIPGLLGPPLGSFLSGIGVTPFLVSLITEGLLNTVTFALMMASFVFGVSFVFGLMEDVGYMARISFVFDRLMSRLGLQGKAVMPFVVCFGCTIGGAAGTRVIESWGQRVLAMALMWAVPCGAILSIIPTLASIFFGGWGAALVMLGIVLVMFLHIAVTARVFGAKLVPPSERTGMIMEMPPYHKPKWGNLLRATTARAGSIFIRAFKVIFVVTTVFFCLTYTIDGNVVNSIIYKIGAFIEPVTRFFGLGWQTFMAFLAAAVSKEAVLGVLNALYMGGGTVFASTMGAKSQPVAVNNLGEVLSASISRPEALAFIFAVSFTVPCMIAMASTYSENHSLKWTLRIAGYYMGLSLVISFLVFHLSSLLF
jgi:ferrous iron transport protein B